MLTKIKLKPGINREVTSYSNEGGWRDCDKIRFRQGFPEKIGGWQSITNYIPYQGVCRSLMEWANLSGLLLTGVGTHLKYYVSRGGELFDITPVRRTTSAGTTPITATPGSSIISIADTGHGAFPGDFVKISGAVSLGGALTAAVLNKEFRVLTTPTANSLTIDVGVNATAGDVGNGGAATVLSYQIRPGTAAFEPTFGWGASAWSSGPWGVGTPGVQTLRLWNHAHYGQDLIYGPRGGGLYYWTAGGFSTPGQQITGNDAPAVHNALLVSDVSRFVMAFGCNELGQTTLDPMLVRWSDQEDYSNWTPAITNQAGGIRLSVGSYIMTAVQNRQEVLVWTDSALYSMQYIGPPAVWSTQLMADNVSIIAPNAVAVAGGVAYWMGTDKFYVYSGQAQTLPCDVLRYVFDDLDTGNVFQICAGTNEAFNEIWWFYPSKGSTVNNRYVVFNYVENLWYYGTMTRTAWFDSAIRGKPIAAFDGTLVQHETGVDDLATPVPQPIPAYIVSSDADIGDGEQFMFVWRVIPDITFRGSTAENPKVLLEIQPVRNPGAGYTTPASVGGESGRDIVRTATVPVEKYTQQCNIRVRGRQMLLRVSSEDLGVSWQLGSPRFDVRTDGKR